MLDRLWFDQLFLGASAIKDDGSIYSIDLSEATINSRMLRRSTERVLLADHTKFARAATYLVAPLSACTHAITDDGISSEWRQRINNTEVHLTIGSGATIETVS
jgi:DeoR family fructose operon transcriptional repressor